MHFSDSGGAARIANRMQHAAAAILLVLAMLLAPGAGTGLAYYSGTGTGTGSSSLGTLAPPTNLAVPATSTGTVHLSWTGATGTPQPAGYHITRTLTSNGSTAAACGTSNTAPTTNLSCDDFNVPAGTYRYTVTSVYRTWTASTPLSTSVSVTPPGTASKLVFITQPANSTAGVAFATQPVVAVTDVNGSIMTSQAATPISLTIPGGALTGCSTATTVNGVATFAGCTATGAGRHAMTATSAPLTSAISSPFTVAGAAAKIAFTASPSNATGGTALAMQPVVIVQDNSGWTVTTNTSPITLSITGSPGGAALSCAANPLTAAAGSAVFTGCSVNKAGTYTLTATGAGFTTASASFTITTGPAAKLSFTVQPSGSTGSMPFATQPAVSIQDAGGNTVLNSTATVNLALTAAPGALLSCAASSVAAINGVSAFTGCSIDKMGSYTLTANSSGLLQALSTTTTITTGAATELGFITQPAGSTAGLAFTTQPVVALQDAGGNTTTSTALVTLSLTGSPAGAVLSCSANPVPAIAGAAAFSACNINKAGTYTLTATGAGFTAVSLNVVIAAGPAAKLGFTTNPTNSTGGLAFGSQPVVAIHDASGNTITASSDPVTLSITAPAGAALSCDTNPVAATAGVATFSGCSIDRPGTYTLTAASGALTTTASTTVTITVGPAAKLGFTTSPTNTRVNSSFTAQPVVAVQDAGGNTVTGSTAPITLKITAPTGGVTLNCNTNPKTALAGVATFAGCSISGSGTWSLTATSGTLAAGTSASLTIFGTSTKLAVTTSPTGATGGIAFSTQPVVTIQDANGNTTSSTAAVSLSLTTPAGAVLSCVSNTSASVAGVATFAGCSINKPGTYSLTATSGVLSSAESSSFSITVGPADNLVFTTSPSGATGGIPFTTQAVVAIHDAGGNAVTTSTAQVALTLSTPAGASLSCSSNPVTAVSGVAVFASCHVDIKGSYTLTASSPGLVVGQSAIFTISAGPAIKVAFTTGPSASTGGIPFNTQPVVAAHDAGGNLAAGTAPVTLSITTPAGAALACTVNPVALVAGMAVFSGCGIDKAGSYTLTATSGLLPAASSTVITIGVGPAARLAFTTQPSGAAANTVFATQPVVAIQDAGGNTVTTSNAPVSLAITAPAGSANLICTANPKPAVAGVASFAGCHIDKRRTNDSLTATSGDLTAVLSAGFDIT